MNVIFLIFITGQDIEKLLHCSWTHEIMMQLEVLSTTIFVIYKLILKENNFPVEKLT